MAPCYEPGSLTKSAISQCLADGGDGVASMFDIPGEAPAKAAAKLRLISHKQLPGGVIWARYRVIAKNRR